MKLKAFLTFLFVSAGILSVYLLNTETINFNDAALGTETVSYYYTDSAGHQVHYNPAYHDIEKSSDFFGDREVILFLGNSQSHSINQKQPGEKTFTGILYERLSSEEQVFIAGSMPNANLQELKELYRVFLRNGDVKLLVLPIFMDDLREDGLRQNFFKKKIQSVDKGTAMGDSVVNEPFEKSSAHQSTQEYTEERLEELFSEYFPVWNKRGQARGNFFMFLYKLRNTVLGIGATTVRRMIPGRYERNFKALEEIAQLSEANGVELLLLIPPIRQDVSMPYMQSEYQEFLKRISGFSKKHLVPVVNLESAVPDTLWGYAASTQLFKSRDYDFMHFQAGGHQILADSLEVLIRVNYDI